MTREQWFRRSLAVSIWLCSAVSASVMAAKELRLSVAEIAAQVGYANQSKFAKVFREKDGVSPLEYRRTVHLGAFHLPHGAL